MLVSKKHVQNTQKYSSFSAQEQIDYENTCVAHHQ